MKQINTVGGSLFGHHLKYALGEIAHGLDAGASRFFRAAGKALRKMQVAKMNSVMHQMTDEQLRRIGITRREIADYVDCLFASAGKRD